jgi:hypothetical protein
MTLEPGNTIGQWTILEETEKRGKGSRYFKCRCSCGVTREVRGTNITSGMSRSCGHELKKRHSQAMERVFAKSPSPAAAATSTARDEQRRARLMTA